MGRYGNRNLIDVGGAAGLGGFTLAAERVMVVLCAGRVLTTVSVVGQMFLGAKRQTKNYRDRLGRDPHNRFLAGC